MKKMLCVALIILSVMLLLPLTAMQKSPTAVTTFNSEKDIPAASKAVSDEFNVCDTATDSVTKMKAQDYIFGVVAAEMPALYDSEALKAQAVAAYTYACYRRIENSDKTYDITTDHNVDQSYISEEKARERWGEKADEYVKKIKQAVEDVNGYMVTYDGKPILSVYHAISSGKTESSKDIWGKDMPYLRAVSSPGDKLSPDYISTVEVSAEDFTSKLAEDCSFSGDASAYFGDFTRTESGTVKEVAVCQQKIRGSRIRSLLDLRSTNYEVKYSEGKFIFTVYGYGHGVGMSQYGANYMAKQGSDFKEILTTYYTGCKVKKIS